MDQFGNQLGNFLGAKPCWSCVTCQGREDGATLKEVKSLHGKKKTNKIAEILTNRIKWNENTLWPQREIKKWKWIFPKVSRWHGSLFWWRDVIAWEDSNIAMNLSFPPAGVAFIQNGYPISSLEAKLVVILGSECVHCLNHLTLNCAQRKFENILEFSHTKYCFLLCFVYNKNWLKLLYIFHDWCRRKIKLLFNIWWTSYCKFRCSGKWALGNYW